MSNQSDSLESVVIGDGVVVKGTFTVPSKAIINGVIEGDLTAEEVLIGPTGKITGRVSAKVIDVRGQLHNTIISEKSLIVRSTGKIAGKVQYSEIEIEKGGEIAASLAQLYEWARRKVIEASRTNVAPIVKEVRKVIAEIADAWDAIGRTGVRAA
jgi:cytoskeletal protein CcmA (bactofilin family)